MRAFVLALVTLASLAALPARAQQQLIPPPYPSGNDSARILSSPPSYRHQTLLPTPYPRTLGPNALGNPRALRPHHRQRLVPPPYPRQYR